MRSNNAMERTPKAFGVAHLCLVRPHISMLAQIARRIAVSVMLLLVFASPSHAAEHKLGFVTQLEGEGFFLNPLVKRILVTEVTKGSLADAAGMRAGDQIIQIEGQSVAGRRARE